MLSLVMSPFSRDLIKTPSTLIRYLQYLIIEYMCAVFTQRLVFNISSYFLLLKLVYSLIRMIVLVNKALLMLSH